MNEEDWKLILRVLSQKIASVDDGNCTRRVLLMSCVCDNVKACGVFSGETQLYSPPQSLNVDHSTRIAPRNTKRLHKNEESLEAVRASSTADESTKMSASTITTHVHAHGDQRHSLLLQKKKRLCSFLKGCASLPAAQCVTRVTWWFSALKVRIIAAANFRFHCYVMGHTLRG